MEGLAYYFPSEDYGSQGTSKRQVQKTIDLFLPPFISKDESIKVTISGKKIPMTADTSFQIPYWHGSFIGNEKIEKVEKLSFSKEPQLGKAVNSMSFYDGYLDYRDSVQLIHFRWEEVENVESVTNGFTICVLKAFKNDKKHDEFNQLKSVGRAVDQILEYSKKKKLLEGLNLKSLIVRRVLDITNLDTSCDIVSIIRFLSIFEVDWTVGNTHVKTLEKILHWFSDANSEKFLSTMLEIKKMPFVLSRVYKNCNETPTVLGIMDRLYPHIVNEQEFKTTWEAITEADETLPSVQIDLMYHEHFFAKLVDRSKNGKSVNDILELLFEKLQLQYQPQLLSVCPCFQEGSVKKKIFCKINQVFLDYSINPVLAVQMWKQLPEAFRSDFSNNFLTAICRNLKDQSTSSQSDCNCGTCSVCCVIELCCKHRFAIDLKSQTELHQALANFTDDAFVIILSFQRNEDTLLMPADLTGNVQKWYRTRNDKIITSHNPKFKEICSLFNNLGKALDLLESDTSTGQNLCKLADDCLRKKSPFELLNECDFELFKCKRGMDLFFASLFQYIEDEIKSDDKKKIEESAIEKWFGGSQEARSSYHMKGIKVMLGISCTTGHTRFDDTIHEVMDWYNFWKIYFNHKNLEEEIIHHPCSIQVKECLSVFDDMMEKDTLKRKTVIEVLRGENGKQFCLLCDNVCKSNVNRQGNLENKIQYALKLENGLMKMIEVLHMFDHRVSVHKANLMKEIEKIYDLKRSIEDKGDFTIKDLENTQYFKISESKSFYELCTTAEPLIRSEVFWNVFRLPLAIEEEACSFKVINDMIQSVCNEGKREYLRKWDEVLHPSRNTIADIKTMFDSSDVKEECEIYANFANGEVNFEELLRWSYFSSEKKHMHLIKNALDAFHIECKAETEVSKIFFEFVEQKSDPDNMTFADFSHRMRVIHEKLQLTPSCKKLIIIIGNNKNVMELLKTLYEEDLRNIIDAVEDYTDQNLSVSTMSNLLRLHQFLLPVLRINRLGCIEDFHGQISLLSETSGIEDIYRSIEDCSQNVQSLERFYKHIANRLETTRSKTLDVVKSGVFTFIVESHKCRMFVKTSETKHLSESELNDLRSRCLLISGKDTEDELAEIRDFGRFIDCVDLAFEILDLFQELYDSGHFHYLDFYKDIQSTCLGVKRKELEEDLTQWKSDIEKYQSQFIEMKYLTFGHIRQIHLYLRDTTHLENKQSVEAILYYLPEVQKRKMLPIWKGHYDPQSHRELLESLVLFLQMEQLPSERKESKNVDGTGNLYVSNLEKECNLVFQCILSTRFQGDFPHPNTVLVCDKETQWDEIHLFFSRCRTNSSPENVFILTHVELLQIELQYKLTKELECLVQEDAAFLHIIVCGRNDQGFVHHFKQLIKPASPLKRQHLVDVLEKSLSCTKTITSSYAGQGKTESVRAECCKRKLRLKHLPISGNVNRNTFVERIHALNLTDSNLLHIDIGIINNPKELDLLLFQVLVLKYISSREYSFHLSTENIIIELGNTSGKSLIQSLPFISCLKRDHIEWKNYDDYVISSEICSPVQVFCHYMQTMESEKLHSKDLYFTGQRALNPLTDDTCRNLLRRHLAFQELNSYALIDIFLNIVSDQLKKLSQSMFFRTENMASMVSGHKEILNIKKELITSLIGMAKRIARRAFNVGFKRERLTGCQAIKGNINEPISWQSLNHAFIIFNNQDMDTISVFSKSIRDIPNDMKEFLQNQIACGKQSLKDLNSMNQKELKSVLWNSVASAELPFDKCQCFFPSYVITTDNLLKMVLISLKVDSGIPVVLMGETGCGKTTLLEYLSKIKNVHFIKINVHAGLNEETILKKLLESNKNALRKLKSNEPIWLFLDEINTTNCIGLLSDALVHHQVNGLSLAPNLTIIAACNPYKKRDVNKTYTQGLQTELKQDDFSDLVYRVYPLPETVLDYVWDFGMTDPNDENKYIKEMVKDVKLERENCGSFIHLLILSQAFVKKNEGVGCSASLREIHRCKVLLNWFLDVYFKKIHPSKEIEENAIFLTLHLGYQSRFKTRDMRSTYWKFISSELNKEHNEIPEMKIQTMIENEQRYLVNQLRVPPGVAKNRALRENVFSLFVCVLTKLPICLVGKPGTSKSLSIQLLRGNMRGKNSENDFFKSLPQLYFFCHQGSESSTSEGIEKVFHLAIEYQNQNRDNQVQVVVLLDEIGLAERSRFEPLKVLHGLLEPGEMQQLKISIVGLSNWAMDPAKMNRLIHISCPDMESDELSETGNSIYGAVLDKNLKDLDEREKKIVSNISKNYFSYTKQQVPKDFHCSRDFYNLLKYVSRKLKLLHDKFVDEDLFRILTRGVDRNFGGLRHNSGVRSPRKVFLPSTYECSLPPVNIFDLIEENIGDKQGRHLMLISSSDVVIDKILGLLKNADCRITQIFGSKFEDDQFEDYSYRILSKIILCMEEGHVLILRDLDVVYGSLFDMLNQNYTTIGKKRHCRIALGPYSNPLCYVHDNFKCIVIVDEAILNPQNSPLLSRFEKQIFTSADMLDERYKQVTKELNEKLTQFRQLVLEEAKIEIPWIKLIPVYEEDILPSVIQKVAERKGKCPNALECLTELLPLFQPEAMFLLSKTIYWKNYNEEGRHLLKLYFNLPIHSGALHYLDHAIQTKEEKKSDSNECSTLSSDQECSLYSEFEKSLPSDDFSSRNIKDEWRKKDLERKCKLIAICTNSNIHTEIVKVFRKNIHVLKLGTIKTEKQLDYELSKFWYKSKITILAVQCNDISDLKHISLTKTRVAFFRNQYMEDKRKTTPKHVVIVIHLTRTLPFRLLFSDFNFQTEWNLVMLDTLTQPFIQQCKLLNQPLTEILSCSTSIANIISEQLLWAVSRLDYGDGQRSFKDIASMIEHLQKNTRLREIFVQKIKGWLEVNVDQNKWIYDVATDSLLLETFGSFDNAIKHSISSLVRDPLANILYHLEKNLSLECFIKYSNHDDRKSREMVDLWEKLFNEIISLSDVAKPAGPSCYHINGQIVLMNIPFSKYFFDQIENCREIFFEELQIRKVSYNLQEDIELNDIPPEVISETVVSFSANMEQCLKLIVTAGVVDWEDDLINDLAKYAGLRRVNLLSNEDSLLIFKWTLNHLLNMSFFTEQFTESRSNEEATIPRVTTLYTALWLHSFVIDGVYNLLEMICVGNSHEGISNTYGTGNVNVEYILDKADKLAEKHLQNISSGNENDSDDSDTSIEVIETDTPKDDSAVVNVHLRCLVDEICEKMYPSANVKTCLREWQQKVNTFLTFALEINVASRSQAKIRFIHDLVCNLCIPYPDVIERVFTFAIDIKLKDFSNDMNIGHIVKDLFMDISKTDVPQDTISKCLVHFALRHKMCNDETNSQPCITVLSSIFEKCNHNRVFRGEPIAVGCLLELLFSDIDETIIGQKISSSDLSTVFHQNETFRVISELCKDPETWNSDLSCFVADYIENNVFAESNSLLDTEVLSQSKEGCPVLERVFYIRDKLAENLSWTEHVIFISFIRRFLFYSARVILTDQECEKHLIHQLGKFFNFDNIVNEKQKNILRDFQKYAYRCLKNGSSSYFFCQKMQEWKESTEETLFVTPVEDISKYLDLYQPVMMDLSALETVEEKIEKNGKVTKSLLTQSIKSDQTGTVLYLFSKCYLAQIFANFPDEEMLLNLDTLTLSDIQKMILECFTLKRTFAITQLCVGMNCSNEHLRQTLFTSMLLIWSAFLADDNNIFLNAIQHPDIFEDSTFRVFLEPREFKRVARPNIFSCESKHRVCVSSGCTSCPFCNKRIGAELSGNGKYVPQRNNMCKSPVYEWIKLILQGLRIACHALKTDYHSEKKYGNDEAIDELLTELNDQWYKVSNILSLTENELQRLCSLILEKLKRERNQTSLQEFIEPIDSALTERFSLLEREIEELQNKKWKTLEEKHSETDGLILRREFNPTSENLLAELEMQNLEEKHPVLHCILNRLHFINLLKFLYPCLKWHRTIAVLGSFYLKKSDCQKMTVKSFLTKEKGGDRITKLNRHFFDFMKMWNELSSERYFQALIGVNKELGEKIAKVNEEEMLEKVLIMGDSSPLLLTIKALVSIQNMLLDEVMEITCFQKCLATSFITKCTSKTYTAKFPIISALELLESDVIPSEFPIDVLVFSQRSFNINKRITFDFQKIESEIALHFLRRAKYIKSEEQKLRILFKDDIAQSSVALLKDLERIFPQSNASDERVKRVLCFLDQNTAEDNHNLLTVLGIAASILPKSNVKSETYLSIFFQNRRGEFSFLSFEKAIPTESKICDIVVVYQWLEEMNGERLLENIDKEFTREVTEPLDNIVNISGSKAIEWELILKGIKLFAHRCLSNKEAVSKSEQLNNFMKGETFWPISVTTKERQKLRKMVPSFIKLHHISFFYKYINQRFRTFSQNPIAEKQRPSLDTNRKMPKRKKMRS